MIKSSSPTNFALASLVSEALVGWSIHLMRERVYKMINSVSDYDAILNSINRLYKIDGKKMILHRTSGAKVYYVECGDMKTVFKLYRNIHNRDALQTVDIIMYLSQNEYPVVPIIPTYDGQTHITLDMQGEENCVGIMFKFIDGVTGCKFSEIENDKHILHHDLAAFGQQVGKLHSLMDSYNGQLINRGKSYYIDRFISLLRRDKYNVHKTSAFEQYGQELWDNIYKLPKGFCHGDIHENNMIYTPDKKYVILDWDMSAYSHSVIDVSRICGEADFNILSERSYDDTTRMFEMFYKGYSKEKNLSTEEINAIYDFIPILHYDLIATIVITSNESIMHDFIDKQFEWLMQWKDLCEKKRMRPE